MQPEDQNRENRYRIFSPRLTDFTLHDMTCVLPNALSVIRNWAVLVPLPMVEFHCNGAILADGQDFPQPVAARKSAATAP